MAQSSIRYVGDSLTALVPETVERLTDGRCATSAPTPAT
jgi:hypothetical protein